MPITLDRNRWLRMFALCVLYVAQGVPYGFLSVTLAAYLAKHGADAGEVGGLVGFAMLPWTFKFAWGPVLDRFSGSAMGRRRPWILLAQSLMLVGACTLIAIPSLRENLSLLAWIMLGINVCVSLQDVAVDALAVDLLPESERGAANGMMYGSSYLGTILGGAVLSTVLGHSDLRTTLILQALMLGAIMLVPLLLRERSGDALVSLAAKPREETGRDPRATWQLLANLARAFSRRSPALGVGLAGTVMAGMMATTAVGTVLVVQKLGWSQEDYGQMIGGYPLVFGLIGSFGGGFLADRMGHRLAVGTFSVLLGLTWIGFAIAAPMWTWRPVIVGFACLNELFLGTLSASLFALFMDLAWPRVAATQFTAYMALLNLSRSWGSAVAGKVEAAFGTGGTYVAFGVFQIAVVVLLLRIDPHQNRRELGE